MGSDRAVGVGCAAACTGTAEQRFIVTTPVHSSFFSPERAPSGSAQPERSAAVVCPAAAFGYSRTAFGYSRTAFGYSRTAFGYSRTAFGYHRTASGYRPNANVRRGTPPCPFFLSDQGAPR